MNLEPWMGEFVLVIDGKMRNCIKCHTIDDMKRQVDALVVNPDHLKKIREAGSSTSAA